MAPLCNFVLVVLMALFATVSSIEVYTIRYKEVRNGSDVPLKCKFNSSVPLSDDLTVTWSFRPALGGPEEQVFLYHEDPIYPPRNRFQFRAMWAGNIEKYDASIILESVDPLDNGTFFCEVKNPPDVYGARGEITLHVINKTMTVIGWLVVAFVFGIMLTGLTTMAVAACRYWLSIRVQNVTDTDMEMETINQGGSGSSPPESSM